MRRSRPKKDRSGRRAQYAGHRYATPLRLEHLEPRFALATGGTDVLPGLTGNEPFVAVNPLNANNVVVAQFNSGTPTLKISVDGGATFSKTTTAQLPSGQTGYDNTMQ